MNNLDPKQLHVLVTGASGYIGSHVVLHLLQKGYQVRAAVRHIADESKICHLKTMNTAYRGALSFAEVDLLKAETWIPAVRDMHYVIHVASPYPTEIPPSRRIKDELTRPAVEGTLNVLAACSECKSVIRVVLTSSINAIHFSTKETGGEHTEAEWANVDTIDAYSASKLLAEKAGWDFVSRLPEEKRFELVAINPSMVLGPPLHFTPGCTSIELLKKLLDRTIPAIPKINYPLVDVRDVALAHVKAMILPAAKGHRFIVHACNMWMSEMSALLQAVFKQRGYRIPTLVAPTMILKLVSKVDGSLRAILPHLDIVHRYDNTKMRSILGIQPRNIRNSIVDMAHAIIEKGMVHRSELYFPANEEDRHLYLSVNL